MILEESTRLQLRYDDPPIFEDLDVKSHSVDDNRISYHISCIPNCTAKHAHRYLSFFQLCVNIFNTISTKDFLSFLYLPRYLCL
jgi:hypothetical protein